MWSLQSVVHTSNWVLPIHCRRICIMRRTYWWSGWAPWASSTWAQTGPSWTRWCSRLVRRRRRRGRSRTTRRTRGRRLRCTRRTTRTGSGWSTSIYDTWWVSEEIGRRKRFSTISPKRGKEKAYVVSDYGYEGQFFSGERGSLLWTMNVKTANVCCSHILCKFWRRDLSFLQRSSLRDGIEKARKKRRCSQIHSMSL